MNTTGSNLCFRPLKPALELGMYLVWKKSQIFSKAAQLFLEQLQRQLGSSPLHGVQDSGETDPASNKVVIQEPDRGH